MTPLPRRGLYAITAAGDTDPDRLTARVSAAIDGGAAMIQYRAKDRTYDDRYTAASLLPPRHCSSTSAGRGGFR